MPRIAIYDRRQEHSVTLTVRDRTFEPRLRPCLHTRILQDGSDTARCLGCDTNLTRVPGPLTLLGPSWEWAPLPRN